MSEGHNEVIIRIYEEVTITVCRIWGTGKQQWPTWSWQLRRISMETGKELPKMRILLCFFVYYMLVHCNVLLLLRFYPISYMHSHYILAHLAHFLVKWVTVQRTPINWWSWWWQNACQGFKIFNGCSLIHVAVLLGNLQLVQRFAIVLNALNQTIDVANG